MGMPLPFKLALFLMIIMTAGGSAAEAASGAIHWYRYAEGKAIAKQEEKKVFLYFRSESCQYCAKMENETFRNPEVVSFLNRNFVSVWISSDADRAVAARYFVRGFPTTWFLDESGEKISNRPGYVQSDTFLAILRYLHSDAYTRMSFHDFTARK
jgi:thioredoxin-related protein